MKLGKILISQPAPATSSPYQELMEKYKLSIDFVPFIKMQGLNAKEFRTQRINILDHTAVVFSTRMAIDAFFHLCEELRVTVPESMKYFCTTEAIALYLQKYIIYRKRKIFFGSGTVQSVIQSIGIRHKDENFLLTLADNFKPEVPKAFEKAGLKHTRCILHRTIFTDLREIDIHSYDMLVFYSPSDIKSLMESFPDYKQEEQLLATFGPATAKAVKEAKFTAVVQAPTPEAPSIVQALSLYLSKK